MDFYDLTPLSNEQAAQAQKDFKLIDKDGNGKLDSDDRDVPLYFLTDIHMNPEPLQGITQLDGIVAVNGDIITAVEYLRNKKKLGSSKSHSIRSCQKGTWTDPQNAFEILKQRESELPLIVSLGNHEFNNRAYYGSSITCLKQWIDALLSIKAIPLLTFPDYTQIGVRRYFQYKNSYFFSYLTSKIIKFVNAGVTSREGYEEKAVSEILNQIVSVCDSDTNEIILLSHAGFDESLNVVTNVMNGLARRQKSNELPFDVLKVHFIYCIGHKHAGSVDEKFRHKEHYWEGKIKLNLLGKHKKIICLSPNCANDCIKVDPDPDRKRCVFAKYITK